LKQVGKLFQPNTIVTASVSSVLHASNTGELAHTNLNTLIFYSSNSLHQFTMSLDQAVKTEYATKSECAVHIEHRA